MLTKILIFLAVVIGVFVVARMGAASAIPKRLSRKSGDKATAPRRAEDLKPCPTCGAWSADGEGCPCGRAPTP